MKEEIYNIQPQNLPVYTYTLKALVAFTIKFEVFLHRNYGYFNLRLVSNLPISKGMFFYPDSFSKGNENVGLLEHLRKKKVLGGCEAELDRLEGCWIADVVH